MKYYMLDDNENRGTLVRAEGRSQQRYIKDKGWIESGIMMEYFCDESPLYDSYVEIAEEEALKLIENM